MALDIQRLGTTDFLSTWHAMRDFTIHRQQDTPSALWLTEHNAVYTHGINRAHTKPLARTDIPQIETDRGGKITYHGHGQIVLYVLLDLHRYGLTIRQLVNLLESSVIALLGDYGITAHTMADMPGVYVAQQKIAFIGLRLYKSRYSYHGMSLNVAMDLTPFTAIDPCGYEHLAVTQMQDCGISAPTSVIGEQWLQHVQIALPNPTKIKE